MAASSEAASVMAPTASFGRKRFKNFRSEAGRCSAVTSQPRIMSSFTRLRPTNPVPPVTNAALVLGGIGGYCNIRVIA